MPDYYFRAYPHSHVLVRESGTATVFILFLQSQSQRTSMNILRLKLGILTLR